MNLGLWEGNTWNQVSERFFNALDVIFEKEKEDILVITHGAVLLTVLSLLNDVPFEKMNEAFHIKNAEPICIEKELLLQGMRKTYR